MKPSPFGQSASIDNNPFLADDISGKRNRILDAVRNGTNCLIYRNENPSVHVVSSENPAVLNICSKSITNLPEIPQSVKLLFIRDNSIKTLERLSDHPNIELIEISSNMLENIDFLNPPKYLKAFIASSNKISSIRNGCFDNLLVLNISENYFSDFDTKMFPKLQVLNLSFNRLRNFRIDHEELIELSLQSNHIQAIDIGSAPKLARLDISDNSLDDISFVENLPSLTHLTAVANKFVSFWESYVVSMCKSIQSINTRAITDGERAIHKDRYKRMQKSSTNDNPQKIIIHIRRAFKNIKNMQISSDSQNSDIVSNWINRSREKSHRHEVSIRECKNMKSYVLNESPDMLTIMGCLFEPISNTICFKALKLHFCPIIHHSSFLETIISLSSHKPSSLFLENNMLNTLNDCLFLKHFSSVRILHIEGNPVMKMTLFRQFISYIIPEIQVINGVVVSNSEKESGYSHFSRLLLISNGIDPQ